MPRRPRRRKMSLVHTVSCRALAKAGRVEASGNANCTAAAAREPRPAPPRRQRWLRTCPEALARLAETTLGAFAPRRQPRSHRTCNFELSCCLTMHQTNRPRLCRMAVVFVYVCMLASTPQYRHILHNIVIIIISIAWACLHALCDLSCVATRFTEHMQ